MIKIIQNDSILNNKLEDNTIIFTSSKHLIKYKKAYIDKEVLVTTLKNYAITLLDKYSDKKLVSNESSIILMWKAYNNVKNSLIKYKNVNDINFSNNLINSYSFIKNNEVINNEKTKDLIIIFKEYERLLEKHGFVTEEGLFQFLKNNIDKIKEQNIIFEDVDKLLKSEINFINELKKDKNVIIYANTINNQSFIDDLNKISEVSYNECGNEDVNKLFEIGAKDLFKEVKIVSANDLFEEVRYIKNDIKSKINSGLKYNDILVVSNDIDRYDTYFKLLFDFPYTKSETVGTLTKNFIELFKNTMNGDFSCNSFINLLKLNIFKLNNKVVNELDNYVYAWNLEEKPFYEPFIFNPSGKKDFNSYDEEKLKKLNDERLSVINPIRYLLENVVKENKTTELLRYLYTYFDEEDIASNLFKKDPEGYKLLISNLELINDLYEESSINEVLDVLSIIQSAKTTTTKMVDEVNISNFNNYTQNKYKQVYFIGLTEKDIPSKFNFNTLINNNDLEDEVLFQIIKKHTDEEQNKISIIMLNKNIIITYHKLTDESSKVSSSKMIDKFYQRPVSYKYELNKEPENNLNNKIDEDIALKLYGNELVLSPSSLEMYSKCKYSYFLKYGLRLKEKEKLVFDNREVGTFVHFILEKCISNKVNKENVDEMVLKYTNEYFKINLSPSSNTLKYVIDCLKDSTVLLLKTILDELENTKFKPESTELKIKDMSLLLKLNKGTLKITGVVDRVDSYIDENNYYYRIIDYKTGVKKFRLDDVLNGLNMQMLIYLLAIKNANKEDRAVIPTGFLYYPALIHFKNMSIATSDEEILKAIKDTIKMNGIINKDNLDLYNEKNIGDYIDIKTRDKINEEKVLGTNDLELVFNKVMKVLEKEGNDILRGDISINPIIDSMNDSCKYCKFNSICKFNKDINKARRFKPITNKEVLRSLEGDKSEMD